MMKQILVILSALFLGIAIPAYSQSDTLFNQVDAKGQKQGYWKKYYPNGNLIYKGFFKDNKPEGEMRRYYESGAIKIVMLFDSGKDCARSTLYYESGDIAARGNYIGTVKDSTWEYYSYYDHSVKARETYDKGNKNGIAYHYFPDGTISEKLEWKENMKNGVWEQYYPNKAIKIKGSYKDDKLNGPFSVTNEKGNLSVQGAFLDNLRHDKWVFYRDDGTIDVEIIYDRGNLVGEDKLTEKQRDVLRMIDENQGKYNEPDETDFLQRGIQ
jgi:antitoxin component YwqK of YwqJK toxin-antitoxin module